MFIPRQYLLRLVGLLAFTSTVFFLLSHHYSLTYDSVQTTQPQKRIDIDKVSEVQRKTVKPDQAKLPVKTTVRAEDSEPALLARIAGEMVEPDPQQKLQLSGSVHTGQVRQAEEVDKYFQGKQNGFFIEAGAWDGEYLRYKRYHCIIWFKT